MPLFMPRFLPLYIPLNKVKDAATKQRLWDNLMATVGTAVTATAVVTAGMSLTVMMVVVVTLGFGVVIKTVCKESLHCFICITVNTAEKLDTGTGKRHLSTATDATANEDICIQHRKKPCQCTVAATVGIYYFCIYDLATLHLVKLKLCGMTEMLKNFTVFIGYCNFHCTLSFSNFFSDFLN